MQPVPFVRPPAEPLSALQHLRQTASHSRPFYLGFYTQITLLRGSTAEPAHRGAAMDKEVRKQEGGSEEMSTGRRSCRTKICPTRALPQGDKPRCFRLPVSANNPFSSFSKRRNSNCNHQLLLVVVVPNDIILQNLQNGQVGRDLQED